MTDATALKRRRGKKLKGTVGIAWSELRLERDLSITELARAAGLSRSVVGLICQGRLVPRPDEARALMAVLSPDGEGLAR